jgi:hypothetical protein
LEGCKSITDDGLFPLRDLDLVYLNLNGTFYGKINKLLLSPPARVLFFSPLKCYRSDVDVSDRGCKVVVGMSKLATLCLSRTRVTHAIYSILASSLSKGEARLPPFPSSSLFVLTRG